MSKRKIPDRRKAIGKPKVRYIEGESWNQRHERRLRHNLKQKSEANEWATSHEITLQVHNEGHHWMFFKGDLRAEWWPSSAKLVFQKRWKNGIHAHDFGQVKAEIEREWFTHERERDGSTRRNLL